MRLVINPPLPGYTVERMRSGRERAHALHCATDGASLLYERVISWRAGHLRRLPWRVDLIPFDGHGGANRTAQTHGLLALHAINSPRTLFTPGQNTGPV